MEFDTICGTVAIVGRPNVGKSTLMNHLIGQKLSITSRKAQTTRHQVMGIWTEGETQVVFVDTPGIHTGGKRALNRYLNKAASNALQDVDLVVWLLERDKFTDQDAHVEKQVRESGKPVIIALNKFDQVHDKAKLMPVAQKMQMRFPKAEIVPLSALEGIQSRYLDESDHCSDAQRAIHVRSGSVNRQKPTFFGRRDCARKAGPPVWR